MVIYAGESNVSVIIDNRNAHEYQIEQSTNGLVKTHTCCMLKDTIPDAMRCADF